MNSEKDKVLKHIKRVGIVLIIVGATAFISNGGSYLILKIIGNDFLPYGKWYLSPLILASSGTLLIISGLYLLKLKKKSVLITIFSTITFFIITTLHWTAELYNSDEKVLFEQWIGSIVMTIIILIPSLLLISFLSKKEVNKNFT